MTAEPFSPAGISYEARLDVDKTHEAERIFVKRALRELWFWESVLPLAVGAVGVALLHVHVGGAFVKVFWFLLALIAAKPVLLLLMRPMVAAAEARRNPSRILSARKEGFVVRVGEQERVHAWIRVRKVWEAGPHYILLCDRYLTIHLPKDGMPKGMVEAIRELARIEAG